MLSTVLTTGDRFVFDCGRCAFKTHSGREITLNHQVRAELPTAHLAIPVIMLLADLLQERFGGAIAVELTAATQRFIYEFKQPPDPARLEQTKRLEVQRASIDSRYRRADLPAPSLIQEAINHHGAEAIAWMLSALCDRHFTHSLNEKVVCWTANPSTG